MYGIYLNALYIVLHLRFVAACGCIVIGGICLFVTAITRGSFNPVWIKFWEKIGWGKGQNLRDGFCFILFFPQFHQRSKSQSGVKFWPNANA